MRRCNRNAKVSESLVNRMCVRKGKGKRKGNEKSKGEGTGNEKWKSAVRSHHVRTLKCGCVSQSMNESCVSKGEREQKDTIVTHLFGIVMDDVVTCLCTNTHGQVFCFKCGDKR